MSEFNLFSSGGAPIAAAASAVRLIDEHEQGTTMLQLAPARPRPERPELPQPRRARSAQRRASRALAFVLIALGALALLDAAVTLVWQEPFSALYAKFRQDSLSASLRADELAPPTPLERRTLAALPHERGRIAFLARELVRHTHTGGAVGRILIPRVGANFVVVRGTTTAALAGGPGIYPETSFPGAGQTTAIAGHRTTYLAPFRHIDQLRPGNTIAINMPYAHFTYVVIGSRVVAPTDVQAAVGVVGYSRLVLSACTPLFSASKRLLVFARLQRTVPVGAGRPPARASRTPAEPFGGARALGV